MQTRPLVTIGGIIALAIVQAAGVLLWGWPVGNVLVLFWLENVIICVFGLVQAVSAAHRQRVSTRDAASHSLIFLFFSFVHGIFTAVLAWQLGVDFGALTLGLPVALLLLRYGVEVAGWATSDEKPTVQQAAHYPRPRIVVLHLSIIAAWWLMLSHDGTLFTPTTVLAVLLVIKVVIEVRATLNAPAPNASMPKVTFTRGG